VSSQPLEGLRLSLVGAGRVGESVASWAVARGARVVSVASRSPARAEAVAAGLGAAAVALDDLASAGEGLLLVAVADPALAGVADRLAARSQARVVLHTSGLWGEEPLAPLAERGSATGAWHPLLAFPRPLAEVGAAAGAVFAIAGGPAAVALGTRLAEAFGGVAVRVPSEARAAYHAAAALAAGGLVAVLATAADVAGRGGLPEDVVEGYFRLARGALEAAAKARPVIGAATGPVARGDAAAVARHLEGLRATAPQALPVAVALGLATLGLLEARGPLTAEQEAVRRRLREAGA
jgi:predicted short-subunit dehydrogenase-like oxidoreductase (DUF2520 family)